ncbi:hypothetical protein [Streptomyces flaveolus]|uniref:hypothetical protein n=1 Tax=Streptomyces flaveolus TaxID=67297 RepID=UPI0033EF9513
MPIGPEVTVLTRAAGSVLRGVSERAVGSPSWPNLHESLLELHEVINAWCEAAERANQALQQIGTNAQTRREMKMGASVGNGAGRPYTVFTLKLGRSYVEIAHREINSIMQPAAPLTQRWSADKRRQAARRSLRSLMSVYCAELLEDFDSAVEARTEWVGKYRAFVDHALANAEVSPDRLHSLKAETEETTAALATVRDQLRELIKEQYPMGHASGATSLDPSPG